MVFHLRENRLWSLDFRTQSMASFCPLVAAQQNCTGRQMPSRKRKGKTKMSSKVLALKACTHQRYAYTGVFAWEKDL